MTAPAIFTAAALCMIALPMVVIMWCVVIDLIRELRRQG